MHRTAHVLTLLLLLSASACAVSTASEVRERVLTRTFAVEAGSLVQARTAGGAIRVDSTNAPAGTVEVRVTASVRAGSDAEATALLADHDVVIEQAGGDVTVSTRRRRDWVSGLGRRNAVSFRIDMTVPSDVRLDVETSGGSISVRGDRASALEAGTSGGSISVDGGRGDLTLATSGGSITVGRTLGHLRAKTSGGRIRVGYVGPTARMVDVDTSGGSIQIGLDPRASFQVNAGTSGGSMSVDGLPLVATTRNRSRIEGVINAGEGILRAHTSGGSVRLFSEAGTSAR